MATTRDELSKTPWHRMLVPPEAIAHKYRGAGTRQNPYLVAFLENDAGDPMQLSPSRRWMLCLIAGYVTFSVAFISSAYASGIPEISRDLGATPEFVTLGLSLFLIGFVLGPLVWAPTSELFGRQPIFLLSGVIHVALNVAICFCPNLASLLVLRLLSGAFGAAPLTNSGGVIADTFPPKTRGLAITVYALVPLFAPVLGPIVGGFVADTFGWRWLMATMAFLSASALVLSSVSLPETYAPVLLRKRAQRLSDITGSAFVSAMAVGNGGNNGFSRSRVANLSRPFKLAVHEPILLLLALYQAIVFGTLYMTFAAFPVVYSHRGWSQGMSGLSFLGVLVGTLLSVVFQLWDNRRYITLLGSLAPRPIPPEARLPGCRIGGVSIVVGLFWFAWTTDPRIHWLWSITAGVPFGFGVVLVTISTTNYLVDSYTIFAASALTVCISARAAFAATFPLYVRSLFQRLGVEWALSVPAFMALACVPFPFVFSRYGPRIRARCKYAGQAEKALLQARNVPTERSWLLSEQNTESEH